MKIYLEKRCVRNFKFCVSAWVNSTQNDDRQYFWFTLRVIPNVYFMHYVLTVLCNQAYLTNLFLRDLLANSGINFQGFFGLSVWRSNHYTIVSLSLSSEID